MSVYVAPLQTLGLDDISQVGGKGANLGELLRAELPVPPGFVITAAAFFEALDEAGIRDELRDLFASVSTREAHLADVSADLRALVSKAALPPSIRAAVLDAYHAMGKRSRCRRALLGDSGRHRYGLFRGHAHDIHQRRG